MASGPSSASARRAAIRRLASPPIRRVSPPRSWLFPLAPGAIRIRRARSAEVLKAQDQAAALREGFDLHRIRLAADRRLPRRFVARFAGLPHSLADGRAAEDLPEMPALGGFPAGDALKARVAEHDPPVLVDHAEALPDGGQDAPDLLALQPGL